MECEAVLPPGAAVRGRCKPRESWRLNGKTGPSCQGDQAVVWARELFPSRARRCHGARRLAMRPSLRRSERRWRSTLGTPCRSEGAASRSSPGDRTARGSQVAKRRRSASGPGWARPMAPREWGPEGAPWSWWRRWTGKAQRWTRRTWRQATRVAKPVARLRGVLWKCGKSTGSAPNAGVQRPGCRALRGAVALQVEHTEGEPGSSRVRCNALLGAIGLVPSLPS